MTLVKRWKQMKQWEQLKHLKQSASIVQHYVKTRYVRRWNSRDSFLRWQEKQIVRHIDCVRASSPFYRILWGDIPSSEWRLFPTINKQVMMTNFDELNTAGIHKDEAFQLALQAERTRDFSPSIGEITIGMSSGTSGNRGLFLVSDQERFAWAGTVLAKALPGSLMKHQKIAFFLRADSKLYQSVHNERIQFEFYDLLEPIDEQIKRLNTFQPSILVAPPSLLRMLAEANIQQTLHIQPIKIISVAEVLDPLDQAKIHRAFSQPVHQIYQCTEGFLASTCRYGTLHLNEDIVCIEKEYVDREANRFIPIITDFNRFTQPIIRYRLNDILTEADGCRCGSIFTPIKSIEGRSDDVFYLQSENNRKLKPVFPDYIARTIITASPELQEYKIIQRDVDQLEIGMKIESALRSAAAEQISNAFHYLFRKLGCKQPKLTFTDYEAPQPGVKLRRVERQFIVHEHSSIIF